MKLGSTPPAIVPAGPDAAGGAGPSRGAAAAQPVPAATAVATDQVALSSAASRMLGGSSSTGDFDSAKVDAIRQAIREGRFTVNAGAIADRLIADATALLGPRTH